MQRMYNVGTECYALLTSSLDPEFLLPVKIIILEKYSTGERMTYRVKIRDIFETDFNYLKEHMSQFRVSSSIKADKTTSIIKKTQFDKITSKEELLVYLNDKPFFLEDNYITLDKMGLKDLYVRFVKYIINFHYRRLFQLTNRSFLANTPIYEDQKEMFVKRIRNIGFGDVFDKFDFELDI